jgi:GNAT superfamily N-acetyltransferase
MALRLTDRVDLDVYYDIDIAGADASIRSVVTRERFQSLFADCPSVGFEADGRPIGGVIFDGRSAHIAVLPAYHGRWGWLLEPMLAWLFGFQREIVVEVARDNVKAIAFMERCGWRRVDDGVGQARYVMTPAVEPFAKRRGHRRRTPPSAGLGSL